MKKQKNELSDTTSGDKFHTADQLTSTVKDKGENDSSEEDYDMHLLSKAEKKRMKKAER